MGIALESKHKQKLEISSANGIQQSCQGLTFKDISNNKKFLKSLVNLYHKNFLHQSKPN